MDTVTVSPKFQVVIPKEIRDGLKIKPGQKLVIIEKGRTIHLVPVKPLKELRGVASGVTSKDARDESERF